MKALLVK